jgi:hypothetical protein
VIKKSIKKLTFVHKSKSSKPFNFGDVVWEDWGLKFWDGLRWVSITTKNIS